MRGFLSSHGNAFSEGVAMKVLVIRHAEAAEPGTVYGVDSQRPLTDRGRRQFQLAAEWLVSRGIVPDHIIHSPLLRARQTAELLADAGRLDAEYRELGGWLASHVDGKILLSHIQESVAETVAVVGHEPSMSSCTADLIRGGAVRFRPGTIACIAFKGVPAPGTGRLEWVLSPALFPA